ncbi:hypothetical protein EfmAA242_22420 [Enterococcus faecium]|nr:hypothetical protein EfmAA242_22420 [Enterococcus faecium]
MKIMKRKNFLTLKKNKHYFLTRGCDRDDQPIRIRRCDTIFVTAKGKKSYDKREDLKRKDIDRQIDRTFILSEAERSGE